MIGHPHSSLLLNDNDIFLFSFLTYTTPRKLYRHSVGWLAVLRGEHLGQLTFSQMKKRRLRDTATHSSAQLRLCPSAQRTLHLYDQTGSSVYHRVLCQLSSSYIGMAKMLVWVFPIRWYKNWNRLFGQPCPSLCGAQDNPPAGNSESCLWSHSHRTFTGCSRYTLCGHHSLQSAWKTHLDENHCPCRDKAPLLQHNIQLS